MNEIKDKTKRPGGEQWALFAARTTVGGHLELPSGGYEEESRTIAERDKIRQSMHRRTAPNADSVPTNSRTDGLGTVHRSSSSASCGHLPADRGSGIGPPHARDVVPLGSRACRSWPDSHAVKKASGQPQRVTR